MSMKDQLISEIEEAIKQDEAKVLERERNWEPERREAIEDYVAKAREQLNNIDPEKPLAEAIMLAFSFLGHAGAIMTGMMPSEFHFKAAHSSQIAETLGMAAMVADGDFNG